MRLIDADALREGLGFADPCEKCDHVYGKYLCADVIWRAVCDAIYEAPTVDAVPVVRCKDCKFAHMTIDGECKDCDEWEEDEHLYLDGDFFCAFGQRKAEP